MAWHLLFKNICNLDGEQSKILPPMNLNVRRMLILVLIKSKEKERKTDLISSFIQFFSKNMRIMKEGDGLGG